MSSLPGGNQIVQRQRSPEGVELLRAFHHAAAVAQRWHGARLAGTVLVALAAPVVITVIPSLERPLGVIACTWVVAARLVLRPAEWRATRLTVSVQEMYDRHVLGLPPAPALRPPALEQVHQLARRCLRSPDPDWYSVPAGVGAEAGVLIAQRSAAVWSRRLYQEWATMLAVLATGWTALTVLVAVARGATLSQFLIAVLLPMLPALLDATDLCQAHRNAATEQSALEASLDQRLDQAARGDLPSPQDLRAIHDEINRQRLAQPPVPDWYYRLRRASYATAMQAAASTLARSLTTAPATGQ
jgi:hypothetical protein